MINCITPLNQLGYGIVGLNVAANLKDCSIYPIGNIDCPLKLAPAIKEGISRGELMVNKDKPSLRIFHQFSLAEHVGRKWHVGFPIFELDKFTPVELAHMHAQDQLFVCSEWAQAILEDTIPSVPVDVVPLGVDREIFHECRAGLRSNKFTFMCVGKWEKRKGHDIIMTAFHKVFKCNKDVRLVMCCDNPFLQDAEFRWIKPYQRLLGSQVEFVNRFQTQEELADLINRADCGLFPARAEGWNLELLEFMSMGKHVIATDYSGHTEFCNAENCNLIPVKELEPAVDNIWFHGQGNWAKLGQDQFDCLCDNMLKVYKNGPSVNLNGISTAKHYSWQNTCNCIRMCI